MKDLYSKVIPNLGKGIIALYLILLPYQFMEATPFAWNDGLGDWSIGTNWTPTGPPTSADIISISNGGTATVTSIDAAANATIGGPTTSSVSVLSNGTLTNTNMIIGNAVGDTGVVSVNGPGALLHILNSLTIGLNGNGTLTVNNGGHVLAPVTIGIGVTPTSKGTLNLLGTPGAQGLFTSGIIVSVAGLNTINFNGGILQAVTNNSNYITGGPIALNVLSGGAFIDTQGFNIGISKTMTGSGNFTKLGTGSLALNVPNSLTGNTFILGGTLLGNTSSFPTGNVFNQGNFFFAQLANGTFAGSISGSGNLIKAAAGALTLTGINTYTGVTQIAGGVLQGTTLSIPSGTIIDNAALVLNQNFEGTFGASISGTGNFFKAGTSTIHFTGNSSLFAGHTTILGGELNVNGILGGATTVNHGTVLSGNGILNNVTNNGVISPGNNSIGTLHVNNLVNNPAGAYLAEISPSGDSDNIFASGQVILNGGNLTVAAPPGIYLQGTRYVIINAAGGLLGQFATNVLPANVMLAVSYLPQQLVLTVLNTVFDTTGLSGNALRVARYIKNNVLGNDPDFLKVIGALSGLNAHQRQKALNQLHPALFEALPLTTADTTHMINRSFIDRLFTLRQTCCRHCCNDNKCCSGVWVAGLADFVRQNRIQGLRRFTSSNEGVALGYDKEICHSIFAGAGAGYSHSNLHWGNSAGHSAINGYYAGIYATQCSDCYYIDATLLAFVNNYRVHRHIHFASIDRTAKHRHYGYGFNPHLGAGFYGSLCSVDIIPYFDLDFYLVQQNRMREHGARSLDLHVKRNQTDILRLETGVMFQKCYEFCYGTLLPNLTVSYVAHRILSGKKYISALNHVDANFAVFGARYTFNQVELGAGLQYLMSDSIAINTWYDVELGKKRQEQEVKLEVNYLF